MAISKKNHSISSQDVTGPMGDALATVTHDSRKGSAVTLVFATNGVFVTLPWEAARDLANALENAAKLGEADGRDRMAEAQAASSSRYIPNPDKWPVE